MFKPGEDNHAAGKYYEVDTSGKKTGKSCVIQQGDKLPPTSSSNHYWTK